MELSIIIFMIIFMVTMLAIVVLQIVRFKTVDQLSKESEAKHKKETVKLELEKQKLNIELTESYSKIIKAEEGRTQDQSEPSLLGIASDILEEVGTK